MAYPGLLMVDDATLIEGMRRCERLGVLAMVHAENGHLVADAVSRLVEGGCTAEHFHHDAHSHIAEAEAVNRAIAIAETTGATLFVVHVSSRDAAARIAAARADGVAVHGETCPQYLLGSLEQYQHLGFEAAAFVCSPPIRERANQEHLWRALQTGALSTIGTDHAAFTMCQPDDLPPQKPYGRDYFPRVPNGVPGIEERLEVMYAGRRGAGPLRHLPVRRTRGDGAGEAVRAVPAQGGDRARRRRRPGRVGSGGATHDRRHQAPPPRRLLHLRRHGRERRAAAGDVARRRARVARRCRRRAGPRALPAPVVVRAVRRWGDDVPARRSRRRAAVARADDRPGGVRRRARLRLRVGRRGPPRP